MKGSFIFIKSEDSVPQDHYWNIILSQYDEVLLLWRVNAICRKSKCIPATLTDITVAWIVFSNSGHVCYPKCSCVSIQNSLPVPNTATCHRAAHFGNCFLLNINSLEITLNSVGTISLGVLSPINMSSPTKVMMDMKIEKSLMSFLSWCQTQKKRTVCITKINICRT